MPTLFVYLCGGVGARFSSQLWSKPMNQVEGRPLFTWSLGSLIHATAGIEERVFAVVYNKALGAAEFPALVRFHFPDVPILLVELPMATRGAIESVYVGLTRLLVTRPDLAGHRVCICDNDNYFQAPMPLSAVNDTPHPFVMVAHNTESAPIYSYVDLNRESHVTRIVEKQKISDWICIGVYGFPRVSDLVALAQVTLLRAAPLCANEYYVSQLYAVLLESGTRVEAKRCDGLISLGTPEAVAANGAALWPGYAGRHLRFVFDLDNTLVTYPRVRGDYSTVEPITRTVSWAQRLKKEGHTIIIHTARRMETHGGNVGRVIADIARVTFDTLDRFDIPYDEVVFGKPLGDFYIDDRAIQPWDVNAEAAMGFYRWLTPEAARVPGNNVFNKMQRCGDRIVKTGPAVLMAGEAFFYASTSKSATSQLVTSQLATSESATRMLPECMFPKCYSTQHVGDTISLELEYVNGLTLSDLYEHSVLSLHVFQCMLARLEALHSAALPVDRDAVGVQLFIDSYILKLQRRVTEHPEHYAAIPGERLTRTYEEVMARLDEYVQSGRMADNLVGCIHGDAWFANMIAKPGGGIVFFDMKGHQQGVLTLEGDAVYDWAKVLQSIVGFDAITVYGTAPKSPSHACRAALEHALRECVERNGALWSDVRNVAAALIMGTFPFHTFADACEKVCRLKTWDLIEELLHI